GAHVDAAGNRTWRDAVSNRVLDQRLEEQVRDERDARVRGDVELHRESVLESDALDLEIVAEDLELAREGNLLFGDAVERRAQQLAQLGNHSLGGRCVGMDERRDGVEGVEEEMWMQLKLETLELGAGEPPLELLALVRRAREAPRELFLP